MFELDNSPSLVTPHTTHFREEAHVRVLAQTEDGQTFAPPKNDRLRTTLGVEQFEDRVVPANLDLIVTTLQDVNNPNDDNVRLTLREAIAKCNAEVPMTTHTITFDAYLSYGPITLNPDPMGYGKLSLLQNIDITGPEGRMHIQRDTTSETKHQLFYVASSVVAKLKNLDLSGGDVTGNGGAITSFGDLTVDFCTIHDNKATDGTGGGIQAQSGSLTVIDSDFDDNRAVHGGGVYLNAGVAATFTGCFFEENIASGTGGGIGIGSPDSGSAVTVSVSSCTLMRNEANTAGGGIHVQQLGSGPGVNLTLKSGTSLANNKATSTTSKGGGVFFGRGTITLNGVTFAYNTALSGNGLYRITGTSLVETPAPPAPAVTWIFNSATVGD